MKAWLTRNEAWVKVKCWNLDRFVVVGFVPDGAGGLAKLRLARREGHALVYAGRVGTGWDHKTARAVRAALAPLARPKSPLTKPIRKQDTTCDGTHGYLDPINGGSASRR
jgi:bifunctional non-homologous end joining protein LigD